MAPRKDPSTPPEEEQRSLFLGEAAPSCNDSNRSTSWTDSLWRRVFGGNMRRPTVVTTSTGSASADQEEALLPTSSHSQPPHKKRARSGTLPSLMEPSDSAEDKQNPLPSSSLLQPSHLFLRTSGNTGTNATAATIEEEREPVRLWLPRKGSELQVDEQLSRIPRIVSRAEELWQESHEKEEERKQESMPDSTTSGEELPSVLRNDQASTHCILNVLQGEVAHVSAEQVDVLVSAEATTCHVIALRSTAATTNHSNINSPPFCSLAHMDRAAYHECVENMIREHLAHHEEAFCCAMAGVANGETIASVGNNSNNSSDVGLFMEDEDDTKHNRQTSFLPDLNLEDDDSMEDVLVDPVQHEVTRVNNTTDATVPPPLIEMELHIVGGYLDDDGLSQQLSNHIMARFNELAQKYQDRIRVYLATAAISSLNNCNRSLKNKPKSRGLGIVTKTGEVFSLKSSLPPSLQGPALEVRAARSFATTAQSEPTLAVIHDRTCQRGEIRIHPFEYEQRQDLNVLLQVPDDVLLSVASTSPEHESKEFCTNFRRTLSFVNTTPAENVFGRTLRKPLVYVRSAGNLNEWEPHQDETSSSSTCHLTTSQSESLLRKSKSLSKKMVKSSVVLAGLCASQSPPVASALYSSPMAGGCLQRQNLNWSRSHTNRWPVGPFHTSTALLQASSTNAPINEASVVGCDTTQRGLSNEEKLAFLEDIESTGGFGLIVTVDKILSNPDKKAFYGDRGSTRKRQFYNLFDTWKRSHSNGKFELIRASLLDGQRPRIRKWDRMISDLTAFKAEHGHAVVTAQDVEEDDRWEDLYRWTRSVRRNYGHQVLDYKPRRTAASSSDTKRHSLPDWKIRELQRLGFCWDLQSLSWDKRYQQLLQFYQEHGHSDVPVDYTGGLGVFVCNCRREYRRLGQGEPSTLTADRLNKLFDVDFVWSRSREESWDKHYKELEQFCDKFGHSNVPEMYPDNPALGRWCVNQRTYYTRRYHGESSSLSEERIQLMEDLGFVWNYHQHKFDTMVQRLKTYFLQYGHVSIPMSDSDNQDLRIWANVQRYYYHHRRRDLESNGVSSVPLTEERIQAIESAIPDFPWRARGATKTGPSSQDWAMLFDEMRKKGIQPGMPMKRHWFDGVNPFSVAVKDTWTADDLMALWNADTEDDGDDDSFSSESTF